MNANVFTAISTSLSSVSTELAVAGVTLFVLSIIATVLLLRVKEDKRLMMIISQVNAYDNNIMVFKNNKLVWMNEAATEVCPHAIKGSSVEDISWKFSGTMEQQASLYKNTYQVYTLDPIEVVATPEDTASEVQTLKHQSQDAKVATKNYKIFSDEMELFENILSTNSYLLMAAGITVFANKNKCELDQFPKFEQLTESFLKIGHYLLKDRTNAHIDFLFDSKDNYCFIQMNLKNFKSSNFAFGEDFFLKGFGTETFEYQLGRLELLFESLGGSLQLVEAGKDFVLIGKVRSLTTLVSNFAAERSV